jgi:RNA polymerase sigma-70 factor (ECF subfamily)
MHTELVEAIQAARHGDGDAYARLVREFQPFAAATAFAWLRDTESVRDVCQESFADAWRLLDQLDDTEAFPGWLRRIVVKHCDRRTRRARVLEIPIDAAHAVPDAAPDPATVVEHTDDARRVRLAIEALPTDERVVVALHYLADRREQDIAAWLDIPLGTVKTRLRRARERLRREMDAMAEETLHHLRPTIIDDSLPAIVRFYIALRAGDVESVRALVAASPELVDAYETWDDDVTERGLLPYGTSSTPLVRAIERDDTEMVQCLLELGADPNARCGCMTDEPPLWTAVVTGRAHMVRIMLDAGADPNQPAVSGKTPFAVARHRGRDDIVQMLLDAGARHDGEAPATGRSTTTTGTGIKAVDLCAPFGPGDRVLMVTRAGVGAMVLLGELSRRFVDRGVRVAWAGNVPRPWDVTDIETELAELGLTGRVRVAIGGAVPVGTGFVVLFTARGSEAEADATLRAIAESQPDAIVVVVPSWMESPERTAATPGTWDACLAFDRRLAARGIYPAISAARSWSRHRDADARRSRLAGCLAVALEDLDSEAGRHAQRFVAQRFFTAEPFHDGEGASVDVDEMMREAEALFGALSG